MDYQSLPPKSKAWVYQADRELSAGEVLRIRSKADDFIANWASHGTPLRAAIEVFHQRFIAIFVDEEHAAATGCSIDKSVHFIREVEQQYNLNLLNRLLVAWREGGQIRACPLDQFERLMQRGEVGPETIVFNNLVGTRAEFDAKWEVPLKKSWHAQLA